VSFNLTFQKIITRLQEDFSKNMPFSSKL